MNGYDAAPFRHDAGDAANWGFFPLFPLLARLWHQLGGLGYSDSLILTGTLALPFAIYLFVQLVDDEAIPVNPWVSGSLVAFNPYAIYAHTGYTEPLYFALSTGALLALKRESWIQTGLLGAACSATRLVGVFLVLPMLASLAGRIRRHRGFAGGGAWPEPLLGIALVPLGLTLFAWHLYARTGDMLGFVHLQVAWGNTIGNPLSVWWRAIAEGGWSRFFAVTAVLGLAAAAYLCARQRIGYGLYLAAAVLVPLWATAWSMPRYVFWQPAFLLVVADLVRQRTLARILLPILWIGSFLMIAAWFSGRNFVN